VLLALGLAALATLTAATRVRERLAIADFALLVAVGEVERSITSAHLWMEEYVSGDVVEPESIAADLDEARRVARAMLEGGRLGDGGFRLDPLDDPAVRERARSVHSHLISFADLSRRRAEAHRRGSRAGIGSALDVEYDRAFQRMLADTGGLREAVVARIGVNRARARRFLQAVVAAWAVVLAGGVAGLSLADRRRRRAEEALRASEAQLLRSQKLEAVGRLAGGMAHDINNYLAAITAQCDRVKMRAPPGDPVGERMEEAIATAMKAAELIRRLLAFARRQPVRREIVDLNAVVHDLEPMMARLLGDDVRYETRLAADLWRVEADAAQVEQVLVNLLVNAREAMPGGGQVTVSTTNLSGHGQEADAVAVEVTDNGVGIPADARDEIFEPFFTTKADSGSSGLGLSIAYGVIAQHGGRIELDSEPGRGTTFTLVLPRGPDGPATPLAPASATPVPRGSEVILLVEDNADLRVSLAAILEDLGYRVRAAGSAGEALSLAGSGAGIDAVVSDVVLPDENGPALVDHLRRTRPGLRALFISGTSGAPARRHRAAAGLDLLEKPFSAASLARALRGVLDRPG
jgi:signal transduction histidine kinase